MKEQDSFFLHIQQTLCESNTDSLVSTGIHVPFD